MVRFSPWYHAKERTMEDEAIKKDRSPQFPFIPLDKAIARAREFESQYGQNSGRVAHTVKVWGYGDKSSGGKQTIAALVAFGLMTDEGSNENRKLKLTPLAMTILKDKRPGAAIKQAALRPKVISDLWKLWGMKRPPDVECVSTLHLDRKFTEEASERLVKIYDATIRFAGLADGDKTDENGAEGEELDRDGAAELADPPPRQSSADPQRPQRKVALMPDERVVFAHEIRPNQSFKIVASGPVDADMVKALKAFAAFQEMLVASAPPGSTPDETNN